MILLITKAVKRREPPVMETSEQPQEKPSSEEA
jgi:hypothetical protein